MAAVVGPSLLLRDWSRSGKVWSLCHWSQWYFGITFSKPSPKRPFCLAWFCLMTALPLFVSPVFFWESKIGSIKTGVAVGFISSTLSSSAIVTSSYRVLLAYFGGVMRHTYMRFISLISHASSFENECWTGSLSRSRTEEFKQYLYFRWKRIMCYGGYFHKQCSWVYAGSVYPSRIRC